MGPATAGAARHLIRRISTEPDDVNASPVEEEEAHSAFFLGVVWLVLYLRLLYSCDGKGRVGYKLLKLATIIISIITSQLRYDCISLTNISTYSTQDVFNTQPKLPSLKHLKSQAVSKQVF